jgi:hypothetical protein
MPAFALHVTIQTLRFCIVWRNTSASSVVFASVYFVEALFSHVARLTFISSSDRVRECINIATNGLAEALASCEQIISGQGRAEWSTWNFVKLSLMALPALPPACDAPWPAL